MNLTKQWFDRWRLYRKNLVPCTDLNEYFEKDVIGNIPITQMRIGNICLNDGEIVVRDPLSDLEKNTQPFFQNVPEGDFPVTICVAKPSENNHRYAALRIEFSSERAVRFEEALLGNEDISDIENFKIGEFFGFDTRSGLVCVADNDIKQAYCEFREKWEFENIGANFYEDYLAGVFYENYKKHPEYQRPEGEWIMLKIPSTGLTIPIVQAGYGDGSYPAYFGFDDKGKACCLIVHFIDIEYEC